MRNFILIGSALLLSACATTSVSDPEIEGVVNKMVTVTADELTGTDPAFVSDCTISVAMSQMALRDSQTDDQNAVMNLQLLVWSDVQERQKAAGANVPSSLVADFESDMEAEQVAEKIADQTIECTKVFTEGMKSATEKLKAEKAAGAL